MNRWKAAFFVALAIAVVSNVLWLMQAIDSGISYSYLADSYDHEKRRFESLGSLVVAGSADYSQADVLHLLRQADSDAFIVEEGQSITLDGIVLVFNDDRLAEVR